MPGRAQACPGQGQAGLTLPKPSVTCGAAALTQAGARSLAGPPSSHLLHLRCPPCSPPPPPRDVAVTQSAPTRPVTPSLSLGLRFPACDRGPAPGPVQRWRCVKRTQAPHPQEPPPLSPCFCVPICKMGTPLSSPCLGRACHRPLAGASSSSTQSTSRALAPGQGDVRARDHLHSP